MKNRRSSPLAQLTNWLSGRRGRTNIQGFWLGPPLSHIHWACLRSFLDCGHEFTLYTYGPLAVPEGIRLADANEIVLERDVFYFQNSETRRPDIAPFSDYFRITLLSKIGGWYCDIDTVCFSTALPKGPRIWARQCPELDLDSVNNSQLFFQRNDPIAQILMSKCRAQLSNVQKRESLGPILISSVVKELDLARDMGATAATFYPIRWVEIFKLWLPEFRREVEERVKGATFLPLYESFPLYLGLEPDKLPPVGSYLSSLISRFVPEATGPTHDADEVRERTKQWFSRNRSWALSWLEAIRGPDSTHRSMFENEI